MQTCSGIKKKVIAISSKYYKQKGIYTIITDDTLWNYRDKCGKNVPLASPIRWYFIEQLNHYDGARKFHMSPFFRKSDAAPVAVMLNFLIFRATSNG